MGNKKQAIVIGLGQFGFSVAKSLTERGVEVLAVDVQEDRVRAAAPHVTDAACFDATDTNALSRTSPERREICVCAIGDEAKEASIIVTALLRQMGAPRIVARANDDLHSRILSLVGAHVVVNPEREFGERFASKLLHEGIMGELPLGNDLLITEFRPPESFVGQTLNALRLPQRFAVTVVAVRRGGKGAVVLPDPKDVVRSDDVFVVVSREADIFRLMERS
jgi:trk system potassium uptake protein TrkA